jgi:hypothetical protein
VAADPIAFWLRPDLANYSQTAGLLTLWRQFKPTPNLTVI